MAKKPESAPEPIVKVLDSFMGVNLVKGDAPLRSEEKAEIDENAAILAIAAEVRSEIEHVRSNASEMKNAAEHRPQRLSAGSVVYYDAGHPNGVYIALCAFAHNATCGNLIYWTHDGHQHFVERAVEGSGKRHWHWPPRV